MRKIFIEILLSAAAVLIPTAIIYNRLVGSESFWNAQSLWSLGLIVCWLVVAVGYFHQGWLVNKTRSSKGVSLLLPVVVFFVQCILFVKGVYYKDISLIFGAVVVNTGVTFNVFQILRFRR